MEQEGSRKDKTFAVIRALTLTSAIIGVASTLSLSRIGRKEVRRAAHNRSEISDKLDRPLEASHISHDRNNSLYQNPRICLLMTDEEHLIYHEDFAGYSHLIGLTEEGNDWAIEQITERVEEYNNLNCINPMTDSYKEMYSQRIAFAVNVRCRELGIPNPYKLMNLETAIEV
jgi:hypothetical protein